MVGHMTTVPKQHKATNMAAVEDPTEGVDDDTLMRRFATTYSEVEVLGKGGAHRRAYLTLLARELDRRDISGKAALDRHGVVEEAE